MPLDRTRDLLILRAGRRLTEVPPPVVARAEELGRDAGKAAASQVFDGSTPDEAYQRVLRGIEDGDPVVLDAARPPAIGPDVGYTEGDRARVSARRGPRRQPGWCRRGGDGRRAGQDRTHGPGMFVLCDLMALFVLGAWLGVSV